MKVLVFLTMPPQPQMGKIDKVTIDHLQKFKAAFLETDAIATIVTFLENPLVNIEKFVASSSSFEN